MELTGYGQAMGNNVITETTTITDGPPATIAVVQGLARRLIPFLMAAGILLPAGLCPDYLLNTILARVLTLESYGTFAFILSLTSVLSLATALGFLQSMLRFIPAYRVKGGHDMFAGLMQGSFRLVSISSLIVKKSKNDAPENKALNHILSENLNEQQ
jgi:hypothetical protein